MIHSACLFLAGFKGVESRFPLDIPIEELSNAKAKAQIEHVQMVAFDGMYSNKSQVLGDCIFNPGPSCSKANY